MNSSEGSGARLRRSSAAAALQAAIAYFLLVFAAGFVLGAVRVLLIAPRVGEAPAVLLELPLMLALSWFACGLVLRRSGLPRLRERALMGAVAFVLLMAAEIALAVVAFGRSPPAVFASFVTPSGVVGLAGQVLFGLFPLLSGSLRCCAAGELSALVRR